MDPTSPEWREIAGEVSACLARTGLFFSLSSNALFKSPFWTLRFEEGFEIHLWHEVDLIRVAMPLRDDAGPVEVTDRMRSALVRTHWIRPFVRLAEDSEGLHLLTAEVPLETLTPARLADVISLCLRALEDLTAA